MIKIKVIVLALMSFCCFTALADDYVVTAKNDTLRGVVSIQTYGPMDHVQVISPDRKKTVLKAILVTTVSLNNDIYNPVRTEQGYRMMKLVRAGFVGLYLGRRVNGTTDTGYAYDVEYLVKRDGRSMEVPGLSFKKAVGNFLSECADMKFTIDKQDLGRADLDKILKHYDDCIEEQTRESKVPPKAAKDDQRIVALNELRSQIDASSLSAKKDALDILADITSKVQRNENIPNYQLDGLKNILKDSPELSAKFDEIVPTLKKN